MAVKPSEHRKLKSRPAEPSQTDTLAHLDWPSAAFFELAELPCVDRPLFAEGDPGDCAYIIEEGRVEIFVEDAGRMITLARRVEGELFGEMAIIDDKPRSASATAVTDCTLLMISRDQLNQRIERSDPILQMCINVVLDHLRNTLRRLTSDASFESGAQQVSEAARGEAA